MTKIKSILNEIGELRSMMLATVAFSVLNIPFTTDEYIRLDNWGLLPDVIAPVLGMMLLFGLLLDILMSKVYMSSEDEQGKQRFRTIIKVEALALVIMVASWAPFFKRMLF